MTQHFRRFFRLINFFVFAPALLMSAACDYSGYLAWSPDGRYVAHIRMEATDDDEDEMELRLWDTRLQKSTLIYKGNIGSLKFTGRGNDLIFLDEKETLHLTDTEGKFAVIDRKVRQAGIIAIADGGKSFYYVKSDEEPERSGIWRASLLGEEWEEDPEGVANFERSLIYAGEEGAAHLDLNEAGSSLLYSTGDAVWVLDLETLEAKEVVRHEDQEVWWPTWTPGGESFVYVESDSEVDPGEGFDRLRLHDIATDEARVVTEIYLGLARPHLTPDGESVVAMIPTGKDGKAITEAQELGDDANIELYQMGFINLETGETRAVTDGEFGAVGGRLDPAGKRMAYYGMMGFLHVRNLDTGAVHMAWANEAERSWIAAEALADAGDFGAARGALKSLLHNYGRNQATSALAQYRLVTLALRPGAEDIDEAERWIEEMKNSDSTDLLVEALRRFLPEETELATDPEDDLILRFPETERNRRKNNSFVGFWEKEPKPVDPGAGDRARDLVGLRVRRTRERLYFRIDYNGRAGLTGGAYQDTIILFDWLRGPSPTRVAQGKVLWDRGAEAQIVIRDWDDQKKDLEILNRRGETLFRIESSKFYSGGLGGPVFWLDTIAGEDDQGSIVFSVMTEALRLPSSREVHVQVCTRRGGKGQEGTVEKMGWNITDAFGEENAPERFEADRASGVELQVRGYAGILPSLN